MNWTFGRKLVLGFSISVLAMLVVGVSGHRVTGELVENDRWVDHTHEVRRAVARVLQALCDAETGQRGFLLTGDDGFLGPYESGRAQAVKALADAQRLTLDNEAQQRRLGTLASLIDVRLQALSRVIEERRDHGSQGVTAALLKEGKDHMDQIRRAIAEIDLAEADLLQTRKQHAEHSAEGAQAVILWGSVLGTVMVALTGFLISRSLSAQISRMVRHIETSLSELQAAANQQATGAKEQATAMNEITTTISELLATSRQIAESARRVADIAGQTTRETHEGDGTVTRGSDAVQAIKRQVDAIVTHMLELGKKSQQIGAVLDIVAELAEQTNILAINATIEASGAGEAGRRFGVVADEIRKLADRVGGSTKEIRGLIEDVRAAVNTTVMTTETGSKAVESGAEQFGQVAGAFRKISTQVATTMEAAKEIELSTKQQATAVEQVNVAITSVAQAAKETEVSTAQTLGTAGELAQLARNLLKLVEDERGRTAPLRHAR